MTNEPSMVGGALTGGGVTGGVRAGALFGVAAVSPGQQGDPYSSGTFGEGVYEGWFSAVTQPVLSGAFRSLVPGG